MTAKIAEYFYRSEPICTILDHGSYVKAGRTSSGYESSTASKHSDPDAAFAYFGNPELIDPAEVGTSKWPPDPGEVGTSNKPLDPDAVGTSKWPPDPGAVGTFEWTPDPVAA
jgi:hypothetical protein